MEEMKELFPEVTFEESLSDNVATLTISNAQTGLSEYMLYAYGGLAALSCAGSAEMRVIPFEGAVVSGTVTSFNSDTDDITIELFADGSTSADYTDTVKGNTAEYFIVGVAEGTYTMRVSKNNHLTREYTLVVEEPVTFNATINEIGDATMNGELDIYDYQQIVNSALSEENTVPEDITEDAGYAKALSDLDEDGYIDVIDCALCWNKIYF